ncbi:MAG: hypothetical protein QM736_04700 [Vicinamibacterales bacterium]
MLGFDNSIIPFLAPRVQGRDLAESTRLFARMYGRDGRRGVAAGIASAPVVAWLAIARGP